MAKNPKNRIKELRAKHNLTQEELARKVGVRRETIVFLEGNRPLKTKSGHKKFCEILRGKFARIVVAVKL